MNAEAANFNSIGQGRLKSRFHQITPPPTRSTRRGRPSASTPAMDIVPSAGLEPTRTDRLPRRDAHVERLRAAPGATKSPFVTNRYNFHRMIAYLNKIICLRR